MTKLQMYYILIYKYCFQVDCGTPPDLTNGNIVANVGTKYEDTATVTCDEGHTLVPDKPTLTCLTNGTWSNVGTCDPVVCVTLPQPDHGKLSTTETGQVYEDEITIICNAGYTIKGTDQREVVSRCLADKTWSNNASCEPINCPEYTNPDFSYIVEMEIQSLVAQSMLLAMRDIQQMILLMLHAKLMQHGPQARRVP